MRLPVATDVFGRSLQAGDLVYDLSSFNAEPYFMWVVDATPKAITDAGVYIKVAKYGSPHSTLVRDGFLVKLVGAKAGFPFPTEVKAYNGKLPKSGYAYAIAENADLHFIHFDATHDNASNVWQRDDDNQVFRKSNIVPISGEESYDFLPEVWANELLSFPNGSRHLRCAKSIGQAGLEEWISSIREAHHA